MNMTPVEISKDGSVASETPSKRPYSPPKLREYGDLRDITMSVHTTGNTDGGLGVTSLVKTGGLIL